MAFGGTSFGGELFGTGEGGSAPTVGAINILPGDWPEGIALDSPVMFTLVGPANFLILGLSVMYRSDRNRYVVYELDGFTPEYAPNSTISALGGETVTVSMFEFGGWRDQITSISAFGLDDNNQLFSAEVLA